MSKAGKHTISIAPGIGKYRGHVLLPEADLKIYLNPVERTLFCLFLAHPEGILADDLLLHWQELQSLYERESLYDDPGLRDDALESLCAESKRVFYPNISRIKNKFVAALAPGKPGATISNAIRMACIVPSRRCLHLHLDHCIRHKIPVLSIAHVPHLVTNQLCPANDRSAASGIVRMSI